MTKHKLNDEFDTIDYPYEIVNSGDYIDLSFTEDLNKTLKRHINATCGINKEIYNFTDTNIVIATRDGYNMIVVPRCREERDRTTAALSRYEGTYVLIKTTYKISYDSPPDAIIAASRTLYDHVGDELYTGINRCITRYQGDLKRTTLSLDPYRPKLFETYTAFTIEKLRNSYNGAIYSYADDLVIAVNYDKPSDIVHPAVYKIYKDISCDLKKSSFSLFFNDPSQLYISTTNCVYVTIMNTVMSIPITRDPCIKAGLHVTSYDSRAKRSTNTCYAIDSVIDGSVDITKAKPNSIIVYRSEREAAYYTDAVRCRDMLSANLKTIEEAELQLKKREAEIKIIESKLNALQIEHANTVEILSIKRKQALLEQNRNETNNQIRKGEITKKKIEDYLKLTITAIGTIVTIITIVKRK